MDIEKITDIGWDRITAMLATRGICDDGAIDEAREEIDYSADFTRDTLADFEAARHKWRECRSIERGDSWVVFEGVQAAKGQQRRDFGIVDIGDFRVIVEV